jgi:hypothetical protein
VFAALERVGELCGGGMQRSETSSESPDWKESGEGEKTAGWNGRRQIVDTVAFGGLGLSSVTAPEQMPNG